MKNTTQVGDELRDHVIDLLEARGVLVSREVRINTKKIDVFAKVENEFEDRTVAIECKNLSRNVGQDELVSIYVGHQNLLASKEIDALWVIVSRDFSPEAKNWARSQQGLQLFTLAHFEEVQFGFKRYVRQVVDVFREQDLDQYYIPQRIGEAQFLVDWIETWISNDDARPVAILGGYGMGKTSFCRFLIDRLGNSYLKDQTKRIPLYVRLSEIAKEQELDGLLGKMLASRYRLTNYNFQDVMALNQRGKFVFIFDGFDEMKHALTWDLFKYNFSQINRAVGGRAKVIIAGRPNAFLSDAEHSWALRGTRIAGEQTIRLPNLPEYHELAIQPFSRGEAEQFLRRYLTRHLTAQAGPPGESDEAWIESRVHEFNSLKHREDFSRPVHLRIFADIATNRSLRLQELSVYELYDLSIGETISREMEKPERLPISSADRRSFLEEIGWWLWEKESGRALNFNPHEVPTSIIRRVLSFEEQTAHEDRLRELFSGAFIERKFGDNFYFAHRSFLEFFVAKKLERSSKDRLPLATIDAAINDEILAFLKLGKSFSGFIDYVIQLMARYVGDLKLSLLREMDNYFSRSNFDRSKLFAQQHVELLFKVLPIYAADNEDKALAIFESLMVRDLSGPMSERSQNAFYFLTEAVLYYIENPKFAEPIAKLVAFMISKIDFAHMRRTHLAGAIVKNVVRRANLFDFEFISFTSVSTTSRDGPALLVDFGRIYNDIREARRPKITVANRSEPVEVGRFTYRLPTSSLGLSQSDRELLIAILREVSEV